MKRFFSLLIATASAALIAGCGGSHCDAAAECEGGNDTDKEACEVQVDAIQNAAEVDGCTDLSDAWFDCMSDDGGCANSIYGAACNAEYVKMRECIGGKGEVP